MSHWKRLLLEIYSKLDEDVQLPLSRAATSYEQDLDLWQRVGRFPIYVAVEVKNPVMLIATLTGIRSMLGQVAPGAIDWREAGSHRELGIVRVGISKSASFLPNPGIADALGLHYVLAPNTFVLALDVDTLKRVVDRHLDGQSPKAGTDGDAQFVVDARSRPGAPLWTALLWAIQGQVNESQDNARRAAEILLRAEPALQQDPAAFASRALAYFGSVPMTASGDSSFQLRPDGAGDAVSGTTKSPSFVALPIAGSPAARLMERLTRVRAEVSFDPEPAAAGPQARSLHTRFEINLGAEQE